MIHNFFEWCVRIFQLIGEVTGLGYFLSNIIVFVVLQPLLIIIFLTLWLIQRQKNKQLLHK